MHVSMCESNSIKEVDPSPPYMNGNSHCLRYWALFVSTGAMALPTKGTEC